MGSGRAFMEAGRERERLGKRSMGRDGTTASDENMFLTILEEERDMEKDLLGKKIQRMTKNYFPLCLVCNFLHFDV